MLTQTTSTNSIRPTEFDGQASYQNHYTAVISVGRSRAPGAKCVAVANRSYHLDRESSYKEETGAEQ